MIRLTGNIGAEFYFTHPEGEILVCREFVQQELGYLPDIVEIRISRYRNPGYRKFKIYTDRTGESSPWCNNRPDLVRFIPHYISRKILNIAGISQITSSGYTGTSFNIYIKVMEGAK